MIREWGAMSNEWDFRINDIYTPIGILVIIEIKNVRTGRSSSGCFFGGGIFSLEKLKGGNVRTHFLQSLVQEHHSAEIDLPNDWIRYRTSREISLFEIDGARAILRGNPDMDYFFGPSHYILEFPDLEPGQVIDFGAYPNPPTFVGVKISENMGIWKEMGLGELIFNYFNSKYIKIKT